MLQKLREKFVDIRPDFWVITLFLITVVLCLANYIPGTWLSGWDTLHPEFNFKLYFERILSVWQEHQGLGAPASQSHAAELPRLLFYYPLSWILPDSALRYFYFFATLVVGTLGVYYFLRQIIFRHVEKAGAFSFTGALVYLLNLGTLQHYYVPLEMFAHHFVTLPWVLLLTTRYIEGGGWKKLWPVLVIAFLVAPIAHTATLFYTFFGLSVVYWSILGLTSKGLKRALAVVFSFLVLNLYWLLPNVYYVLNHGHDVTASKIHTQFTEKAFLTGQKFGGLTNTAFLKNFLFDWGEYDEASGRFVDLFDEWQPHLSGFIPFLVGYLVFILVIFGAANSLVGSRPERKYAVALLPLGLISFLFIANHNFVSETVFSLFEQLFPVFREAFRFPFTKLSIILAFCYAVFASLALYYLTAFISRFINKGREKLPLVVSSVMALLLVFYMFPAFGGNLISRSMKHKIPQEYFEMFDWFAGRDKNTRVATFPVDTFWGWAYYHWGYEGAGFRWFGIPQATLDREFDRWNPYNENFYWEASHALYSGDLRLFERVFDKYQVSWLYLDEAIISPWSPKALAVDELKNYLATSGKFVLERKFGTVKVYRVNLNITFNNHVFMASNLPTVAPEYRWNNYDKAYLDEGNYKTDNRNLIPGNLDAYYPFRSLFTGKEQGDLEFKVEEQGDQFVLRSNLPRKVKDFRLVLPSLSGPELLSLDKDNLKNSKTFTPEVKQVEDVLEVKFPKVDGYYAAVIDPATDQETKLAKNCNNKKTGTVKNQVILENEKKIKRLRAKDTNNCSAAYWFEHLPHNLSYLIMAESRNVQGQSLLFWLENLNVRKSDQEAYLPNRAGTAQWTKSYFVQPSAVRNGAGYALHFDNISIGSKETVNDLGRVTIRPFPYRFLAGIYLHPTKQINANLEISSPEVVHQTPDLYQVSLFPSANKTLVLSQAYHDGWKAYSGNFQSSIFNFQYLAPILGKEIKEHVKVNNWENGWKLPENTTKVTILFWPQYLQFAGYLLALSGIIGLIVFRRRVADL